MDTALPAVGRKPFNKKKIIRFAIIGIVILLIAAAVFMYINMRKNKAAAASQQQRTTRVVTGNIGVSITGSAPVESADRRELSPKVTSKVVKVNCKAGDTVKAGDVLFELDDTDAQLSVEDTRNNIAQTQLTQDNNEKSVAGLTVKAPYSGQVTNIQLKNGDTAGKGSPILTITDVSRLKVTLPFNGTGIMDVTAGKKATVYLQDLMQSVDGTVTYVSSKPYTTSAGGELYNVEISVDNPGSLKEGMKANAEIETSKGTITSVDGSTLAYIDTSVLRSDAGGTVKSVNVTENQYVNAGDLLLSLQNDDLKLTLDTTDLKLQSLQRQLEIQEEQLTYYKITAPNDGTIASMDAVEGDTVKPGDVLAVVSDMGHMQFSVTIDELDIAKVKAGQKVNITVDALPDTTAKPLTGTVTDVAMEGTSSGGVTTYPVTISLDKPGELKAGMNANAEIMISDKQNVLMVPLEAIQKFGDISFVWVQSDGTQSDNAGQGFGYGPGNNSGSGNGNSNSAGSGNGTFNRRNRTGTSGSGANGSGTNGAGTNGSGGSGAGASGNGAGASGNDAQQNAQSGNAFANAGRSSASANPYYANARLVRVETGINNDTYIEIVSGLQEGETVILPPTTSGTDANTQNRTGLGGMGGFLGGISGGNTGGNNNRPAQYFRGD